MGNFLGTIMNTVGGAAQGYVVGGPVGAIAGGVNGAVNGGHGPSNLGNIASSTDPTLAASQFLNHTSEWQGLALQAEEMRHQNEMLVQSQEFNDVQNEKSEQMRELNTLRDVAMKQREADNKIVKEFIKSAGGE